MVAETLAKRFWQQVMKKKRRNALKGTKCAKRYALLSYYVMGAHFTASTTSGHCLSWKEGREDAREDITHLSTNLSEEFGCGHLQLGEFHRRHQHYQFLRFHQLPPCLGLFLDPRIEQQLGDCVFCRMDFL